MKNNQLKSKSKSNFIESEAFAVEAGDMLNGMMSGMAKSVFKTKLFWASLTATAVGGAGTIWFCIWAVQTLAGG